jgi:hypothetical protein
MERGAGLARPRSDGVLIDPINADRSPAIQAPTLRLGLLRGAVLPRAEALARSPPDFN